MVEEYTIEEEVGLSFDYAYNYDYGIAQEQDFSGSVESTTVVEGSITSVTLSGTVSPQTTVSGSFPGMGAGTIEPVTTINGDITNANAAVDLGEQWQILRDGTTVDDALYDTEITDTYNPFGNVAIAKIDDTEGNKFEQYTRGTRVDFEYSTNLGISWTERFTGYVVESRELENQGADALEVECYSFDQFLRRDVVTNDQSGNTISEALEDIITVDTPVTWDASNVTIQDDQTLTQSLRGERVENAIQILRSKSANERFGVNSDIEFFFEPQETTSAPRNITNGDWFNYDIPEEGKRTINQVTVYFDDGNRQVTVDDASDKLDLQNSLGTDDPIVFAEEITREEITNIEDARDEGEKLLSDRATTLTGTVTTYGLLEAETGDVISIEIIDRGIDGQFQIAELKYLWGRGETVITIVEKRGNQDDLLVGLSDTVKRTEMRPADRDSTQNRITNTTIQSIIDVGGDVDGTSYTAFRYTNTGRNKVRDGWADNGNLDITDIAVGDGTSSPSRTDDSLVNELERESATQSLPDSTTARYTADFTTADISEVGLFTSDGSLVARAVLDGTFSGTSTVTIDLEVSNDSSVSRGVMTNTGQTTTRDIIADNSPSLPTQYAYGTDATDPTVSDTSLGNETTTISIDEILVQSADIDEDWDSIIDVIDTDPVEVLNGELQVLQTCFTREGEDADDDNAARNLGQDDFSDGDALLVQSSGDYAEWDFTLEYDIPSGNVGLQARIESNGQSSGQLQFSIDDTTIFTTAYDFDSPNWVDPISAGGGIGGLSAGTHTLRIEQVDAGDGTNIDVVAPYDNRYSYTFDDTLDSNQGYLSGPELFPDVVDVAFAEVNTRRTLQNATCTQVWNDVSNNQYIELSNDGGNTWITTNNSQTATANFASPETRVRARVGLSRYGSRTSATPTSGFNGQGIDSHELEADVDAINPSSIGTANVRAIVAPGTISSGTNLREGGELDSSDNLLTHTTGLDVNVTENMRIESSEAVSWNNVD